MQYRQPQLMQAKIGIVKKTSEAREPLQSLPWLRMIVRYMKQGSPDEEILRRGFDCFDALYSFLQKR